MADFSRIKRLGTGAFGEVWLEYDKALGIQRAVKYVLPNRVHDPTDVYTEPRTLETLRHPNIVEVHDAYFDSNRLRIVMEYVPEGSLEDRYEGAPAPLAEAIDHLTHVCRGLEHAHNLGFLHRDIKPANVLASSTGAKLSDFGLATRVETSGAASPYGYLAHLAPEVINSGATTQLTDVYALGVTAYRLMNGDEYLVSGNLQQQDLEDAILEGRFPARTQFQPYIPNNLRRIVRAAIEVDPIKRPQTPAALRHRLEGAIPHVSFQAVPTQAEAEWIGTSSTHEWKVRVEEKASGFSLLVQSKPLGGQRSRRSKGDCGSFGTRQAAMRETAKILQRIAAHGR